MLKRLLSGLAIWTLIVGFGFAFSATSVPVAQGVTTPAVSPVPDAPPMSPQLPPEPSLDRRMRALEHRVRVDMILYTGPFGQGEWAGTRQLDAVALTLGARSK